MRFGPRFAIRFPRKRGSAAPKRTREREFPKGAKSYLYSYEIPREVRAEVGREARPEGNRPDVERRRRERPFPEALGLGAEDRNREAREADRAPRRAEADREAEGRREDRDDGGDAPRREGRREAPGEGGKVGRDRGVDGNLPLATRPPPEVRKG